ncbi:hypothetical protein T10_461, partial [Trichinella papuae]
LNHTNFKEKQWVCQRKKMQVLNTHKHRCKYCVEISSSCGPFRRYTEEASSASADFETAGQFPTYKNVKTEMHRWAETFPPFSAC